MQSYAWILAAYAALIAWPGPLTLLLCIVVLGSRQLALEVLMHEAAHGALFRSPRLNQISGKWLCAAPVFLSLHDYRKYHMKHHRHTGQKGDPDLPLRSVYPMRRKTLVRAFLRDLGFRTGARVYGALLLMHAGILEFDLGGRPRRLVARGKAQTRVWLPRLLRSLWPTLVFHGVLLGALWSLHALWAALLWPTVLLTVHTALMRVRSIAEHAATQKSPDILLNTRTTLAGPLERFLFAPIYANYHIEHHLFPAVPFFKLPALHRELHRAGYLSESSVARGYLAVMMQASARPARALRPDSG